MNELTRKLAHMIVKDGEGATKFVEVRVCGLESNEDCLEVAYTVAHSPLVKTALFASDANWGRILAAVGRARVKGISFENINISLNLMLFRILTSLFNPSLKTCLFGRSNIAREKTRQMLAIFDPITLPIAIIDCPSKLDKIEIKISGDDVPNPIIKKLERNPDI